MRTPIRLRYGFEIETVGVNYPVLAPILRKTVPVYENDMHKVRERGTGYGEYKPGYWAVTEDSSLPHRKSAEVISPISPPFPEVRRVVEVLKKAGCYTTDVCGLHIHVSEPNHHLRIQLPTLKVWKKRLSWCNKYEQKNPLGDIIYRALEGIRQVEWNHLEVRVFNSKLSYPYILWAWGLVKKHLTLVPQNFVGPLTLNDYNLIPV
jgi:hypothetical protein